MKVGSATLTEIDEVNKTVSGTFEGDATTYDQKSDNHITNGVFYKIPFTTETNNTFSADIGENHLKANSIIAFDFMTVLTVGGSNYLNEPHLTFDIDEANSSPGLHTISAGYQYGETLYESSNASLTINHHDTEKHTMDGTFTMTLKNTDSDETIEVTNGVFNVEYKIL